MNPLIKATQISYYVKLSIAMRSEMTLNYRVLVEKYPFPNRVAGGSIPDVKSSLFLTGKNN